MTKFFPEQHISPFRVFSISNANNYHSTINFTCDYRGIYHFARDTRVTFDHYFKHNPRDRLDLFARRRAASRNNLHCAKHRDILTDSQISKVPSNLVRAYRARAAAASIYATRNRFLFSLLLLVLSSWWPFIADLNFQEESTSAS